MDFNGFITWTDRGVMPYGEAFTSVAWGRTKFWKLDPYWSKYPVYYETYRGDGGAAQTFTLSNSILPYADDGTALQIWEAGTKLTHTTNYTVSTTTGLITFVATDPADGAMTVCKVCYVDSC